jgi:hypothetical protein
MHLTYHESPCKVNAVPPSDSGSDSDGGTGAPAEIEVTPAMLDAGYSLYVDQRFALEAGEIGARPLLTEIFRAMALVR